MRNSGFLSVSLVVCLLLIAFSFPYTSNALHEPQGSATTPEPPPGIKVGVKLVYMSTKGGNAKKRGTIYEDIPSTVLEIRGQWLLIEDYNPFNPSGRDQKNWLNVDHLVWYQVDK
jgi:hypothetical protein